MATFDLLSPRLCLSASSLPLTGAGLHPWSAFFPPRCLDLPHRRPRLSHFSFLRLADLTHPSNFKIVLCKQNFPNPNMNLEQAPSNLFLRQGACHISVKSYLIIDLLSSLPERVSALCFSTYGFTFSANLVQQSHSINVCEVHKLAPAFTDAVGVLRRHTVIKINNLNYSCSIKTTPQI